MNARGHRALDRQCTQVDAFGASRLRSLQGIDEREKIAPDLVVSKTSTPDPKMDDAGAVVAKLDATTLVRREGSGKIGHITHHRAGARIRHQPAAPQDGSTLFDLATLIR